MLKEYKDYQGVIHVHSRYSDGSGSLKKIVGAANRAELDYLIITDHNILRHKEEGAEGWHDKTLVLVGEEVSPFQGNHYLALGIEKPVNPEGKDAQEYIDEVKNQGGLGFIAHPDSQEKRYLLLKKRPWTAWEAKDFTGIELWSYMYDWLNSIKFFNLFYYFLCPARAIKGPSEKALKRWDKFTQERPVVAIGGADAHARHIIPGGILKLFPYHQIFSTLRTHILTSPFQLDLDRDRSLVYSALRKGHSYISYDYLAEASGFIFRANTKHEEAIMGDEIEFSPGLTLRAFSPRPASLRLIGNGEVIKESEGNSLEMSLSSRGVYRLEVHLEGKPWIFTNPIYVR